MTTYVIESSDKPEPGTRRKWTAVLTSDDPLRAHDDMRLYALASARPDDYRPHGGRQLRVREADPT